MSKKSNSKLYIVFGVAIISLVLVGMVFNVIPVNLFIPIDPSTYANLSKLSFATGSSNLSCDAFNKIIVDGRVVANGKEGFTPFITLNLVDRGINVENVSIELWLVCGGNLPKDADRTGAGSVSGKLSMLLCAGSSPEICFASGSRVFETIDGVAQSTTKFNTVNLVCSTALLGSKCAGGAYIVEHDVEFLVYRANFSDEFLEKTFPAPKQVTIVSKMYPDLAFTFVTNDITFDSQGNKITTQNVFRANYDSLAQNDVVYSQYNGLSTTIPDTDGDGFLDNVDGCINQPETFNGFEDDDGCPDSIPIDTDGDGIPDDVDECSTEPETFNGFQDSDGCPDLICADDEIFNLTTGQCEGGEIIDCPDGEFLNPVDGQCIRDPACTALIDPVCGTNDITYVNSCFADNVGVDYSFGECEGDGGSADCITVFDPVCGVDGNTYGNSCELGNVTLDHLGECGSLVNCDINNFSNDCDNDGVRNQFDLCQSTPANTDVDADGCSVLQLQIVQTDDCVNPLFLETNICVSSTGYNGDYDSDGVPDIFDDCITQFGTNSNGCPSNALIDSDLDGVPDINDQCPDTSLFVSVGQFGCEVVAPHDDVDDPVDFIIDCIEGFVPNPDGSKTCIEEDKFEITTTTTTIKPSQGTDDRNMFVIILVVIGIIVVVVLSATGKIKL